MIYDLLINGEYVAILKSNYNSFKILYEHPTKESEDLCIVIAITDNKGIKLITTYNQDKERRVRTYERWRHLIEHAYHPDADALFINMVENYDYDKSIELTNDIILDFDVDRKAVALEILGASKVFNVSKFNLKNIGPIEMKIGVNEKLICVELSIGILIHNKEILKSLNQTTVNNINATSMNIELATA